MGPNERDMAQINLFRETVDACQLCYLGYIGLDWTFERKLPNHQYVRVRLDRALASADWCTRFPFASVHHLYAVKSDHSPILLLNEMEASNQRIAVDKPFRYEVMWERHDNFRPMIEEVWSRSTVSNASDLCTKIDLLAGACASWGISSFGGVRKELRELRKKLAMLRSDVHRTGPTHEELKVEERIAELGFREEIMWRQKARVQWLAEGDKNTRFFHQKANMRRRKNKVERLVRSNGTVCENP